MHLAANPNTSTYPIEDFIAALSDIHIEDRIQRGRLAAGVVILAHELSHRFDTDREALAVFAHVLDQMEPRWRAKTSRTF